MENAEFKLVCIYGGIVGLTIFIFVLILIKLLSNFLRKEITEWIRENCYYEKFRILQLPDRYFIAQFRYFGIWIHLDADRSCANLQETVERYAKKQNDKKIYRLQKNKTIKTFNSYEFLTQQQKEFLFKDKMHKEISK